MRRGTILQTAKGLYKVSRPFSTLSGILSVLLGGYVAGTSSWGNVWLAAISTMFISAAANAWNDYLDVEIDRINQPTRPLPAGLISLAAAANFSYAMMGLSILLAAFINLPAFLMAFFSNIILYLYSWRLKSTVLIGNATVALISALSAFYGGVAAGNGRPALWLTLIIFVAIMGREVLKTLADYDGDLRHDVRTVATAWGKQPARRIFYGFAVALTVVMMLPYLLNQYSTIYAIMVILGVYPIMIYIVYRLAQMPPAPQLEKLSQLMKYDFLIWFTAVFLGTTLPL